MTLVDAYEVQLLARVAPYTVISPPRLKNLARLLRSVAHLPGDVVECGVAGGGSAAFLATLAPTRMVRLFDSFQGLPAPLKEDGPQAPAYQGANKHALAEVRELLVSLGVHQRRLDLVPGWFHETFPRVSVTPVALLHLDCDWYASVTLCLETWVDAVVPGGVIVLDDYGFWPGCRLALHEFLARHGLTIELHRFDDQAWFVKDPPP
jgi:O-methyltransferase